MLIDVASVFPITHIYIYLVLEMGCPQNRGCCKAMVGKLLLHYLDGPWDERFLVSNWGFVTLKKSLLEIIRGY